MKTIHICAPNISIKLHIALLPETAKIFKCIGRPVFNQKCFQVFILRWLPNSRRHGKRLCVFSCTLQPAYMTFPPRTVCLWKSRSVFPWYVYVIKAPQVILMYNLIEEPLCQTCIPTVFLGEGQHMNGMCPVAGLLCTQGRWY